MRRRSNRFHLLSSPFKLSETWNVSKNQEYNYKIKQGFSSNSLTKPTMNDEHLLYKHNTRMQTFTFYIWWDGSWNYCLMKKVVYPPIPHFQAVSSLHLKLDPVDFWRYELSSFQFADHVFVFKYGRIIITY